MRTRTLTLTALLTALLCLTGPLTIPFGPVPASLMSALLMLTACLLGARRATTSCLVYLILGMAGLPVLSGFTGGAAHLLGPTGGYLLGYLPMTWICGAFADRTDKRHILTAGMLLGTLSLYAAGTAWYCLQAGVSVAAALSVCVWPFMPFDLIKIAAAIYFGPALKERLKKAGLV